MRKLLTVAIILAVLATSSYADNTVYIGSNLLTWQENFVDCYHEGQVLTNYVGFEIDSCIYDNTFITVNQSIADVSYPLASYNGSFQEYNATIELRYYLNDNLFDLWK